MKTTRTHCRRTAVPAALLAGLLLLPVAAGGAETAELLPAGEAAPAFEAVTIDGSPFVFEEEISGGPIFLVFWSIF